MSEEKNISVHSVIIENRKKINMSGIEEVRGCDEENGVFLISGGILTVKGEGLNIVSFSKTTGELVMEGTVTALAYSGDNSAKGLLRRILK